MAQIDAHIAVLIILGIFTLANTIIISLVKLGVSKFSSEMKCLWEAIDMIREKQESLRETLPKEYLRIEGEGYKALIGGIKRIEIHLEQLTKDIRDGKYK